MSFLNIEGAMSSAVLTNFNTLHCSDVVNSEILEKSPFSWSLLGAIRFSTFSADGERCFVIALQHVDIEQQLQVNKIIVTCIFQRLKCPKRCRQLELNRRGCMCPTSSRSTCDNTTQPDFQRLAEVV